MSLTLELDDSIVARSLKQSDAHDVHGLMSVNRSHLDKWLRWSSAVQTLQDV